MKSSKRTKLKIGDPVKIGRCPENDWTGLNVEFFVGIVRSFSLDFNSVEIELGKTGITLAFSVETKTPLISSHFKGLVIDGYYYAIDNETAITKATI